MGKKGHDPTMFIYVIFQPVGIQFIKSEPGLCGWHYNNNSRACLHIARMSKKSR